MSSSSRQQPELPVIDLGPLIRSNRFQNAVRPRRPRGDLGASSPTDPSVNAPSLDKATIEARKDSQTSLHTSGTASNLPQKRVTTEQTESTRDTDKERRVVFDTDAKWSKEIVDEQGNAGVQSSMNASVQRLQSGDSWQLDPSDGDDKEEDDAPASKVPPSNGPSLPEGDNELPPHPSKNLTNEQDSTFTDNDVLCGRGGYVDSHVGNVRFRQVVLKHFPRYCASKRKQKPKVVAEVLDIIRQRGGRFLLNNSGELIEIDEEKARRKCSQVFRDTKRHWSSNNEGQQHELSTLSPICPRARLVDEKIEHLQLSTNSLQECSNRRRAPRNGTFRASECPQVTTITDNDVLPDSGILNGRYFVGNRRFHQVVREHIPYYVDCQSIEDKTRLIQQVVRVIRKRGGRFVGRDVFGNYVEIGNVKAYSRCCKAMEEAMGEAARLGSAQSRGRPS